MNHRCLDANLVQNHSFISEARAILQIMLKLLWKTSNNLEFDGISGSHCSWINLRVLGLHKRWYTLENHVCSSQKLCSRHFNSMERTVSTVIFRGRSTQEVLPCGYIFTKATVVARKGFQKQLRSHYLCPSGYFWLYLWGIDIYLTCYSEEAFPWVQQFLILNRWTH